MTQGTGTLATVVLLLGVAAVAEGEIPKSNSQVRLALHAGDRFIPSKDIPRICDAAPDPDYCEGFNRYRPAPGSSTVYLYLARFNYAKGFTFGLKYCGSSEMGIDPAYATWYSCGVGTETYFAGEQGSWPAPGSGIRIEWETCLTGHPPKCGSWGYIYGAFLGAMYVYTYSDDLLEMTTAPTDSGPIVGVIDCEGNQEDLLALTGYPIEWHSDAVSFGNTFDARGCNLVEPPCFGQPAPRMASSSPGPCDSVPIRNTTWGLLKNRYPVKRPGNPDR